MEMLKFHELFYKRKDADSLGLPSDNSFTVGTYMRKEYLMGSDKEVIVVCRTWKSTGPVIAVFTEEEADSANNMYENFAQSMVEHNRNLYLSGYEEEEIIA